MPRPIRLGRGIESVPTSVFIEKEGCFFFGAEADDRSAIAPRNYRRTFKLDIGSPTYVLSAHIGEYKQKFTAADLTKIPGVHIATMCFEIISLRSRRHYTPRVFFPRAV